MGSQSVEVRLARIEEGLVGIHGKMDAHHNVVLKAIAPIQEHETDITVLKRDRWWLFSLAMVAISLGGYSVHLLHP